MGAARRYWQERYLDDLADVLSPPERGGTFQRVVLLSGGIDSLLVLAILNQLYPNQILKTVTIDSANSLESAQAGRVAEYFATDHCVTMVDVEEVLEHLPLVEGCHYDKLSRVYSHICYYLAMKKVGVRDAVVYSGHGADILYGNKAKLYLGLPNENKRGSLEEQRTRAKISYYRRYNSAGKHLIKLANEMGAKAVLPYRDSRLAYVNELPYSLIQPLTKQFVRDAIQKRFALGELIKCPSMGMQTGTGEYEEFRQLIKKRFRHVHRSSKEIAAYLTQ
ncbi:asparagine synthase C-terminal domain-containing protein [Vibrio sinaloensis]|uniref:asparagine synthase C-terminal domain-containing protein n=1 Tax=Photobacterium sp. (strain ATCC 43367) TaxID=379097 RepID=UPI0035F04630